MSFTICYVLVDNGVDVSDLLSKVGIEASDKAETAGTVAIAYAAHKAASPIRFPPTVALTPLTAKVCNFSAPTEPRTLAHTARVFCVETARVIQPHTSLCGDASVPSGLGKIKVFTGV